MNPVVIYICLKGLTLTMGKTGLVRFFNKETGCYAFEMNSLFLLHALYFAHTLSFCLAFA